MVSSAEDGVTWTRTRILACTKGGIWSERRGLHMLTTELIYLTSFLHSTNSFLLSRGCSSPWTSKVGSPSQRVEIISKSLYILLPSSFLLLLCFLHPSQGRVWGPHLGDISPHRDKVGGISQRDLQECTSPNLLIQVWGRARVWQHQGITKGKQWRRCHVLIC